MTPVTRYLTTDGREFKTELEATNHENVVRLAKALEAIGADCLNAMSLAELLLIHFEIKPKTTRK